MYTATLIRVHSEVGLTYSMVQDIFENLIVTQLVKNSLLLYGNGMFIIVLTKAGHWTLS
jgi:hypothetical protein